MAESTHSKSCDVMDKILLDFADFKCSICLEVYIDATWTSCNHLFCRFCISKWLEFSLKCPQCHTAVSKCTSVKAIDEQVDSLFQALPLAIRKDRDEVKDRRRKLETEGSGSIEHTNELLKKLRVQRDKAPVTMMNDEQWMEKLDPYFQEENDCSKLQLPRLVPAPEEAEGPGGGLDSKMKGDVKTMVENGKVQKDKSKLSTSQYENLKLPPITRSSSRLNRQARGITTTTCVQNAEDKFPMNMEGDISKDKGAEENIRELERRNTFLEEQLFGAYDRIMDAIKENDENLAKNVDPNVFKDNQQLRQKTNLNTSIGGNGVNRQVGDPNFSKESMINPNDTRSDGEIQLESTSEVDDLLAETEDLIEIEDFLTKYPFERIRDDDNLINYNADVGDFDDELGVSVGLDQDKLDELAAHRAQRAKKPLTKEQQDIENFYKKLELKFQKQDSTHGLPVAIKVPKSITQETSSSKMKRIPNLNKFRPGPAQIPSNQPSFPNPAPLLNRTESKSSVASKISTLSSNSNTKISKVTVSPIKPNHSILKSNVNVLDKLQLRPNEAKKSISKITNGYFDEPIEKEKQITRNGSNTTIVTTSKTTSDILVKKMPTSALSATSPSAFMATPGSIKVDGCSKNHVPNLNYEDFLKLEIDFLDGEGDWKQFDKPPKVKSYAPHKSSISTNNANNCQQIKGRSTSSAKSNIIVSAASSNKLKSSLGGNNSQLIKMKSAIIEEDKQPFNRVGGIKKSGNITAKNSNSASATSSVTSSVTKTMKLGTTRNRR